MADLPTINNGDITGIVDQVKSYLENPVVATVGAGVVGVGIGAAAVSIAKRKKSSKKKKRKSKRKTTKKKSKNSSRKRRSSHRRVRKSHQRKPRTAGKGRDRSTRRIRFTKHNQPYVILKSGKARFIKKSSVSSSRKRKGGKY